MSKDSRIRVLIVDDHRLVRDGLELLLSTFDEFQIVGMAADGERAVASYHQLNPDVALMDMVMPVMDGPTATANILAQDPDAKIIALSSFVDDELVQRAIGAGAVGYLLKNASPEQLAAAIRAAYAGQPTIDAEAAQALIRTAAPSGSAAYCLTQREGEVLALLVEGKTNKEIATDLFLSTSTVHDYVSQILAKLNVSNRTEAAALAVQENLLSQ